MLRRSCADGQGRSPVRTAAAPGCGVCPEADCETQRPAYSGTVSPEPPNSAGKSFSFGKPSRIGSTVSA